MNIKTYILLLSISIFFSCNSNSTQKNLNRLVLERMEDFIYSQYEDSYDYEEIKTIVEETDSLCWEKDLYRIQYRVWLAAKDRRTIVANSYIIPYYKESFNTISQSFLFSQEMGSIFKQPYVDVDNVKGLNKSLKDSYVKLPEREVCDYIYYRDIPTWRQEIEELENEEFNGWRIYHSCQFRLPSGVRIQKEYVLYHEKKNDRIYESPIELTYNYPVIREFIKEVLSANLEDENIINLKNKYMEYDEFPWSKSHKNNVHEIYQRTLNRFRLD